MSITEAAPLPLSAAFKQGSKELHDQAEAATFIDDLMNGKVNLAGYVNYLKSLRIVYAALEEVARDNASDPIVAVMHDPALERLASIEADIEALSTGAPEESLCQHEAAQAYAAAIHAASGHAPRVIAHHYTRYLGDLSGGLAIGRILGRTFDLEDRGLAMYHFEDIKAKVYKDDYRERLDNLPFDDAQRAEAVTEVQAAFRHNQAVFAELGKNLASYQR
ncbi:heme oxygenase (biliverdin-producing) [Nocardioides jishulii]|uniref:Biliverdin-producing heme oxygenase n=1 Tax=Nocardioides jishulii TaxID=2575440 RepID=A0A4U2YIJ9_9ACTN|nr:biliverdin-producing heme oxygenase [Nocardioides jishulii]QCX28273.1 biliverdin-producing heme oxygenase [Nocardioides jishulii]TKI60937.1 biliverdin-producing heme oxygenase [Nocardioides jishulii]